MHVRISAPKTTKPRLTRVCQPQAGCSDANGHGANHCSPLSALFKRETLPRRTRTSCRGEVLLVEVVIFRVLPRSASVHGGSVLAFARDCTHFCRELVFSLVVKTDINLQSLSFPGFILFSSVFLPIVYTPCFMWAAAFRPLLLVVLVLC